MVESLTLNFYSNHVTFRMFLVIIQLLSSGLVSKY